MATHFTILHIFLLSITWGGDFAQSIRKELRTTETSQDKYLRLGNPVQRKTVDPSRAVQLSWQPRSITMDIIILSSGDRVFLYRDFLSGEECDYLISWVRRKRSFTGFGNDSINFGISMDEDDEINKIIEERISAWTFLPKENSKSLSVLHFGPEDAKQKYNYFHNESEEQARQPLLATVILYLSNVSKGGHILFPQSENKMWSDCAKTKEIVKPMKGNAILFFSLNLNATPDRTSFHSRCPISEDDMWCATKFIYLKKISSENYDSPQSDINGDCTDEDDNCPSWAAIGECLRNSVFMIGSPDYYGTCRKSCNAC
ncbi:hypothetical protein CASFOL_006904 [Castilleja foliolosa]|uniref:procollagen-proline 4-dioxygenase n=1 Tax=Castilleja foliolosa TaxID=1961234 RepID=A0ABD3EBK6_9LAMI